MVASAGDVNGDGYDDVVVGKADAWGSGAHLYYGSASGLSSTPDWTYSVSGAEYNTVGRKVASAGDVNNDGYDDIVLGGHLANSNHNKEGVAVVFFGSASGPASNPDWSYHGGVSDAEFGSAVASAGDLNGDGYDDIAVGAPKYNGEAGRVYVFYGGSSGPSSSPSWTKTGGSGDKLGFSVGSAGDVDADGYDDVLVGAYCWGSYCKGFTSVYYGSSSGLSSSNNWGESGPHTSSQFGYALAGASDVNADGYDDIVIGAPGYQNGTFDDYEGGLFVYLGSASGLASSPEWIGESDDSEAYLGRSIAMGDFNGDGNADVLGGAPEYTNGQSSEGVVFGYYGASLYAEDLSVATDEDVSVTITLAGHVGASATPTYAISADPTNGTLSQFDSASGTVVYTPDPDYNGSDQFTYTVSDGTQTAGAATVDITVHFVNDPPQAVDDSATTVEGQAVTIDVLQNDSDPEGNFDLDSVDSPSHGTTSIQNGQVRYTPSNGFSGTDTFTYTISDHLGVTDSATVTVTVTALNDPPSATDDSASVDEDQVVTIDVLQNDSDPDGDPLTIDSVTTPANGQATIVAGEIEYVPDADYYGSDSFSYTISDGNAASATASVTVSVMAVNDAPLAADDSVVTLEDTAVVIDVLQNDTDVDGDTLTITAAGSATNGATSIQGDQVLYQPNSNYSGTDTFTYTVSDGNGATDSATVNVTVTPVNDAPVAMDDSVATDEGTAIDVDVLANDTDVDGDTLDIASVGTPSHGTATIQADMVRYTPAADYVGSDSFGYTVSDGSGATDSATVSVTVHSVNEPPTLVAPTPTTDLTATEGTELAFEVAADDPDADILTYDVQPRPAGASMDTATGDFRWTPQYSQVGTQTLTLSASDGQATDSRSIEIDVEALDTDDDGLPDEIDSCPTEAASTADGCPDDGDAGPDAGGDAGPDAGADVGGDSGPDAGADAGVPDASRADAAGDVDADTSSRDVGQPDTRVDAGTDDAGSGSDAATVVIRDPTTEGDQGCACNSTGGSLGASPFALLGLVIVLGVRRRCAVNRSHRAG